MRNKVLSFLLSMVFVSLLPSNIWAETRRYTPPPQRGDIYMVIRYKAYNSRDLGLKTSTTVNVSWGSYKRKRQVSRPAFNVQAQGFVLKLRHLNNDSVEMTVETDGTFITVPYQGNPPPQWNDDNFKKEEW